MKNKSLYIIMIIAIILGAIIVKTKGFNYSTLYSEHKRVEIIVGKEYELKDIEKIADESIKEDHITRKATLYGTSVTIDAKDITDDELNTLLQEITLHIQSLYQQMITGDIRIYPTRSDNPTIDMHINPCRFCHYKAICNYDIFYNEDHQIELGGQNEER